MEDKLTKCSTGFRKSHGTQNSRLTILERGERAIGKKSNTSLLYLWTSQNPLILLTLGARTIF